jgi:hypothetical protein
VQYPDGYIVDVSDGTFEKDEAHQRLRYHPSDKNIPHFIVVKPAIAREVPKEDTQQIWIIVMIVVVFAWLMSQIGRKKKR